jgi:deoxyribonuclease-2
MILKLMKIDEPKIDKPKNLNQKNSKFKTKKFNLKNPKNFIISSIYPQIVEAIEMRAMTTPPFYNLATLYSRFGAKFTSFAKSKAFAKELYEDLVAPHYSTGDFYVESWQHGRGNIVSDCSRPTKVYNVKDISIGGKIEFSTQHDHSKWLVSGGENELVCVGDINRQEHQKVRGGGTVCTQIKELAMVYGASVDDSEPCKKMTKKKLGWSKNGV